MRVHATFSAMYLLLMGCAALVPASFAYSGGLPVGPRATFLSLQQGRCSRGRVVGSSCRQAARSDEAHESSNESEGFRTGATTSDSGSQASSSSSRRRDLIRQIPAAAFAATVGITASSSASLAADASSSSPAAALTVDAAAAADSALAAATKATQVAGPLRLPPMGLGAWAWGDSLFWGYDKKNDDELRAVFEYALETSGSRNEPTLIDTAEIYGFGRSETLVGQFAAQYPSDRVVVATKFAALPFRTSAKDVVKACKASLKRLDRESIDVYQIHFPNAWSNAEYWDGLADCVDQGLVKAVGVSNYGVDAVRACHDALQKRGIPLATNQIQFSLLYRYPVENGLLQCCQDLGVQVLSYSPLALGMLTGKYTKESPPSGPRKALYEKLAASSDYDNLLAIMKDVAAVRPGATLSQVALNWARAKGTIPIPGARTLSQIQQNLQALSWSLSPEEARALDVAASKVTSFIAPGDEPFAKEDINTHMKMFDS